MKKILIVFGGNSPEHEVSIITGLQVMEKIDRTEFLPIPIYIRRTGEIDVLGDFDNRSDFNRVTRKSVFFGRDSAGAFIKEGSIFSSKIYFDCAYICLHGGPGESGQMQGLFEIIGSPYTSPNTESSAICMNKSLTKTILESFGIKVVKGETVFSNDIVKNSDKTVDSINVDFPVIVKPVHMGSSIGIGIAKTKIELKKQLLRSAQIDTEMLVEEFLSPIKEYNVSVIRSIEGNIEVSEIERPIKSEEILSFEDKYKKGAKKSGGMASANRELPAKLSSKIEEQIKRIAIQTYKAIRAKGLIRIDFMIHKETVYVTEINPIPGSMSFYLWEASGKTFKLQISELINISIKEFEESKSRFIEHNTDIVEKFVNSTNH